MQIFIKLTHDREDDDDDDGSYRCDFNDMTDHFDSLEDAQIDAHPDEEQCTKHTPVETTVDLIRLSR